MLKLAGKNLTKKGSPIISEYIPQIFINDKWKDSDITVERPGRHLLHHEIRRTSPATRHIEAASPHWQGVPRRTHRHLRGTLAKMQNLNPTVQTHQTDPNWGTFCKTTDCYFSKGSRSWRTRKKLRNCQRLKGTQEKWLLSPMWNPGLDPGISKRHLWTTWGNLNQACSSVKCCTNVQFLVLRAMRWLTEMSTLEKAGWHVWDFSCTIFATVL